MTVIRQDAWTQDEDTLLAEVTLRHIREGSTQLSAFEEVGEKLSRTPAACGFRWNSLIRKQYESAISLAKKQRKERHKGKEQRQDNDLESRISPIKKNYKNPAEKKNAISIEDVIVFLKSFQSADIREGLDLENKSLRKKVDELKKQNGSLQMHLQKLTQEYSTVCQDYKALIQIMERARKIVDPGERVKETNKN